MPRIHIVHWNDDEAKDRASLLRQLGYNVQYDKPSPAFFREIKKKPPDIFLIDLSRIPSQGRDVALNLRISRSTRNVPIVFVDGASDKVEIVKRHLPDAIYTTWSSIRSSLKMAMSSPPANPVIPRFALDGYSDAPLVKKLGIKSNTNIVLLDAPSNFKRALGELPEGAKFSSRPSSRADLVIWFATVQKTLSNRIISIFSHMNDKASLWICWPKKTSRKKSDLSQAIVRHIGLDIGLVDYKVCSIDETWSGLKFIKRK